MGKAEVADWSSIRLLVEAYKRESLRSEERPGEMACRLAR